MRIRTLLQVVRSGDMRARTSALRDGQAAMRVSAVGAGLRTGVLEALGERPATVDTLAQRFGWTERDLLEGFLHVLSELGLVDHVGHRWELARRGRGLLGDDMARAVYEGFSDYHTGLYDGLEQQLNGGPARRDVADKGEVIARLSRAMDPFVRDVLDKEVGSRRPRRVLDVGCATGSHLAYMLAAAPTATGVGVETDPGAAEMARATMSRESLTGRARIVEGDARAVLAAEPEQFDLVLLANVIYYLPPAERVPLLRSVAERTSPGGAVVLVSTARTDALFSRHFDLLLRAQDGAMELPDMHELGEQLREAGLVPGRPRRIAPGEPLTALVATRA